MSKRHENNVKQIDKEKTYSLDEAIAILSDFTPVQFDETVELVMILNIDVTKSDQLVRGSFSFPHGTGQDVRVVVIAGEADAEEAKKAGAAEAGGEELIERIEDGWLDFDIVIAHPSMMKFVGKLGRILGPKGLMPSPKSGTVVQDIPRAVNEFSAGKIEYRNDRLGNIQVPVGKRSFSDEQLVENIQAFYDHIRSKRPAGAGGTFIKQMYISSTMSPGLKITV